MTRFKLELEFESETDPMTVIRQVEKYAHYAMTTCVEDADVDEYTVQCYVNEE